MKLKLPGVVFGCNQPFVPGQTITGKVSWMVERTLTIRNIQLLISGKCKVKWTEGSGDNAKDYKEKEVYVNHEVLLYGEPSGESSVSPGSYSVPFSYTLPYNIPPTYQGKHGSVKYSVCLILKEPGIFGKDSYTMPFVVSNRYTASDIEQGPLKLNAETDKYGCCDDKKGNFRFDINADYTAYYPGQVVYINGYALSESPERKPAQVTLELVLNEAFFGRRTQKLKTKRKKTVAAQWENLNGTGSRLDFQNQTTLVVPDVPESDMRHCQFIEVFYSLEFTLRLPTICSTDLLSASPVKIMSSMSNQQSQHLPPSEPMAMSIPPADRGTYTSTGFSNATQDTASAPPSYFQATTDASHYQPPMPQPSAMSGTAQGVVGQTSYYDWSQSAFTYS